MNQLLRKETKWKWTDPCEERFKALKDALISAEVLCPYNRTLPLGLACNASAVDIGAVIFHNLSDGSEKSIAYASRTLLISEANYSQTEREALNIIIRLNSLTVKMDNVVN